MSITEIDEDVMRALRQFPDGVTTKVLAERLQMNAKTLACRLGKLALYGKLDRERIKTSPRTDTVWRMPG